MAEFSSTTRIALTFCFLLLMALASLIPGEYKPGDSTFVWLVVKTPTLAQKSMHVFLYGILVLLLVWTLDSIESRTHRLLISAVIAITFGALMELCQTLVPGRFGTAYDVALNSVGVVLGLVAAFFMF